MHSLQKKISKRNGSKHPTYLTILFFLSLQLSMYPIVAHAMNPIVTDQQAYALEQQLKITVKWKSQEPIVKILVTAGKEQTVVTDDISNRAFRDGYYGEKDILVPFYIDPARKEQAISTASQNIFMNPPVMQQQMQQTSAREIKPAEDSIVYTIQLIDDVGKKSAISEGKVTLRPKAYRPPDRTGDKGAALNVGLTADKNPTSISSAIKEELNKIDLKPSIKEINLKKYPSGGVSAVITAKDDKGIQKISYEIRNSSTGEASNQNEIICAEKQVVKETVVVNLSPGRYKFYVTVVDTGNNSDFKESEEFTIQEPSSTAVQQSPSSTNQ